MDWANLGQNGILTPSLKSNKTAGNPLNTQPISRYPVPEIGDLPEDIRAKFAAIQEKLEFVPNVFLAFAHRPNELRAFMAYSDALMDGERGLSKAEREMIVVTTSAMNQCQYCVIAHGATLRIRARAPHIGDQLAANYRKADVTPRQKAMLDFAVKVSRHSEAVCDEDFVTLKSHGWTDEDAWDIGAISAFFAMSNRMANFISLRPDAAFYLIGRVPR